MAPHTLSKTEIFLHKIVASAPLSFLNSHFMHHVDNAAYRLSKGRTTLLAVMAGLPVITLTTTGAKSGLLRTLPLIGIRDTEDPATIAIIASNWGQNHSPGWYYNLKANPQASGTIRGKTTNYVARETIDAEYDYFWDLAINTYAGYRVYKVRASNRRIPIMVLTPVKS